MDGIHDLGGMQGFGPLEIEADEPVFHDEWEGRVFAMNWAVLAATGMPIDAARSSIEQLPPADYLNLPYFGRWFNALCVSSVASGVFTPEQMAQIQSGRVPDVPAMEPAAEASATPGKGLDLALAGSPSGREIEDEPAFRVGDPVRARRLHPAGHTRLPRYVRGCRGVVLTDRGGHVFPDSSALGLGENPCHLYSVRFSARELWGNSANSGDSVTLDLWEPYLEPA